jgi:hypothetical protein
VIELRNHLDGYARQRLTLDDFESVLDLDADLVLEQVTPELFQALERLEPFGQANPEPVFSARGVRLMAPPKILKDKHVKLKLAAALAQIATPVAEAIVPAPIPVSEETAEALIPEAILVTPRCHPEAAAIPRGEVRAANENQLRTENRELGTGSDDRRPTTGDWRKNITFDALGWHMAERLQAANLLAGDTLDIAFTVGHNDHPEYGGLELSLRDFRLDRERH